MFLQDLDDIDDLLAKIEEPSPSKPVPKAKARAKAAAKKRPENASEKDDDLDALLAEVLPEYKESEDALKGKSLAPPNAEGIPKDTGEEAQKEVTAKTLKNRLKKIKKKQATGLAQEDKEDTQTPASKAKAKVGPKPVAALLAQKR